MMSGLCFGNWTFSHYEGFTAKMYDKVLNICFA